MTSVFTPQMTVMLTMKKAVQLRMKKMSKEQVSSVDDFEVALRCFLIICLNERGEWSPSNILLSLMHFF